MTSHIKLGVALRGLLAALLPILLTTVGVYAQEVTGVLGSPSATTTIKGNQIPAPEPKFGGVIKENATESKPWWPPTIVPPKGAPNVLLIMTDDQGYGVSGTFGGTTRGAHHGFDCRASSLITPPNCGSGGGSCFPSIVVVAPGEPGVPVTCWAKADPKQAMTVTVDNNSIQG